MNKERLAIVTQDGRFLIATEVLGGLNVSNQIDRSIRRSAAARGVYCQFNTMTNAWELTDIKVDSTASPATKTVDEILVPAELTPEQKEHIAVVNYIDASTKLRPTELFMSDLKWKYLVRSVIRGKNIQMTGPTGCGKTLAAKTVANALQRPFYYFNLGATQDPRSALIGNTHFKKDSGTYFAESQFVKAIQTENAVILLDEFTRAHPEAGNILMTVLDYGQRYLRLDEKDDSPVIHVAKGVSFIATSNIGNEYTATRVQDRALIDRFVTIEMDVLTAKQEAALLKQMYPFLHDDLIKAVSEICEYTRKEIRNENSKISTMLSTRSAVEMASLLNDNFNLREVADVVIFPFYSEEGGADSERTFMKQFVQKYLV